MGDVSALLDLVGTAYDAARGVASWGALVHGVGVLLGAEAVGLRRCDPDGLLEPAFVGRHLSEPELTALLRDCHLVSQETSKEERAGTGCHRMVVGARACEGPDHTCALGSVGACYLVSARSSGRVIELAAIRRTVDAPLEAGLEQLRALVPHLVRASELERERLVANETLRGLAAAASQSPNAVLIVDGLFRIRFRNETADRFLEARLGWSEVDGRLALDDPAVACALRAALGRPCREPDVLRIERGEATNAASSLLLVAEPLTSVGPDDAPPSRRLLIVLAGPAVKARSFDSAAAAALYRLTPAEARLAERLGEGARLEVAAAMLGITLETARTYLKSLFRKTRTTRQSELVRLLLLGPRRLACAERGSERARGTVDRGTSSAPPFGDFS